MRMVHDCFIKSTNACILYLKLSDNKSCNGDCKFNVSNKKTKVLCMSGMTIALCVHFCDMDIHYGCMLNVLY